MSATTGCVTTRASCDFSGNLSSLTPPGRPTHAFTWDSIERPASYVAPSVTGVTTLTTTATFDADSALSLLTTPDGTLKPTKDSLGRVDHVEDSRGAGFKLVYEP